MSAKMLLHLGTRPAVDQALSRLARRGKLLRAGRGMYVSPIKSRFGTHAPSAHRLVEKLSTQRGETVAPSGAVSANALGLTTQVPTQTVYWTSGRSRTLTLGKLLIQLEHVPPWQLALAKEPAGEIVRALAWAGPERAESVLREIERKVPKAVIQKVALHVSRLPLHPHLVSVLMAWHSRMPALEGWVFGSPQTNRPYHRDSLHADYLAPAGRAIGIPRLGFHDFRHTYRSMLRDLRLPIELQQKLMRHADISMTARYGASPMDAAKREANALLVGFVTNENGSTRVSQPARA